MTGATMQRVVRRRFIEASPERLFEAWTTPSQLLSWWGPRGVRCTCAEFDLRAGGGYRLGNELPDGRVVFIVGQFLEVDPPTRLVYTWSRERVAEAPEQVTVRFRAGEGGTEVVVTHERIRGRSLQQEHAVGWDGCLEGLAAYLAVSGQAASSVSP